MDPAVLILVLTAAVFHASWNAIVKSGGDAFVRLAIGAATGTIIAVFALPFLDFPNAEVWPFILASVAIHMVYFTCVALQYRFGDLSHVYPISRGAAPILVAAGAFIFAGESLSPGGIIAVVLICAAILSLTLGSEWHKNDWRGVFFALCTAGTIAAYTIVDGLGGRRADDVFAYIAYLFLLDGILLGLLVIFMRRRVLKQAFQAHWKKGAIGGVLSFFAYALVVWAMTRTPMTYVSALRETSVILAAFIGTRLLNEPFGARRIAAAACVAVGVILLQISQG